MPIARTPKTAALLGFAGASALAMAAHASTCTDLATTKLDLDHALVDSQTAQDVPAGQFTAPDGEVITLLNPACRVSLVVSSIPQPTASQIAIEVWLPEAGWNGRYLGLGNGGFAGSVIYGSIELGLLGGFASANTDMGTGLLFGCNSLYCGDHTGFGGKPGGLYHDPAAIRDFGFESTHLMTRAAKLLVQDYYGTKPSYSYFDGCSTGGQQALSESQRFPGDYNGILAGAPAHNRTHLHEASAAVYEATHFAADAYLTNAALTLIHGAVLSQCAGKDGGLATDDFLTQPAQCKTHAQALICTGASGETPCTDPNAASCSCLTPHQAHAMDRIWSGAVDNHGDRLYPGSERGSEEPVPLTAANGYTGNLGLVWQQAGSEPAFDSLMYWALGPNWVWQEMFATPSVLSPELASEIAAVDNKAIGGAETFAGDLNANVTNLQPFVARNGRMLMYAGYADPLIPSATAIDYYNAVAAGDPAVESYLRLFMAPGVWHCRGGPGANTFGNLSPNLPPKPLDPSDDALGALIAWVEQGVAPTQIIATKYTNDDASQGVAFQRPLCLYPANAAYNGHGADPTQASSYTCTPGKPVTNQTFAPKYGP